MKWIKYENNNEIKWNNMCNEEMKMKNRKQ